MKTKHINDIDWGEPSQISSIYRYPGIDKTLYAHESLAPSQKQVFEFSYEEGFQIIVMQDGRVVPYLGDIAKPSKDSSRDPNEEFLERVEVFRKLFKQIKGVRVSFEGLEKVRTLFEAFKDAGFKEIDAAYVHTPYAHFIDVDQVVEYIRNEGVDYIEQIDISAIYQKPCYIKILDYRQGHWATSEEMWVNEHTRLLLAGEGAFDGGY